ncbi:MAG: MiaB/RimO family radical SAM methylthiotransferase, partial [Candidatus Baltobacteraceae bacterium]
ALASRPEQANVLVLNTCTVREAAERRAYGRMGTFKTLKETSPGIKLVVMGCLAEQDRNRMQKLAPHVDAVFGTKELVALGDTLRDWRPGFLESEADESALLTTAPEGVSGAFTHLRAFVTVQRGCSYYCSFCIVPHVRGRFDHRPIADILTEAAGKLALGAREVMLVGQTVNAYKDPATGQDFGELARRVAALPGLERLTFISPHPKDFSEKIIRDLAEISACNPRMHLPLQSASDPILRRMNRKYTIEQFNQKVALIHKHLPSWAITTDIIVGFPGESDADFESTRAYCASGVFAQAFMFIYSPRRGTPAANWEQVPEELKSARFARLKTAQDAATRAYHDRKIGTTVRALITGPSKKDSQRLAAKTTDNVTVIAPMPTDYDEALYAREPWIDYRVATAHVWGCSGSIVARAARYADWGSPIVAPVVSLLG